MPRLIHIHWQHTRFFNIKVTIQDRQCKASKMSNLLLRALRTSNNVSTKLTMNLFDQSISPILLYWCAVWGTPKSYNLIYLVDQPECLDTRNKEGIWQYDSCNTGELDRHAQHQQPCLASRTPRVVVRQKQPVLSGTHCSSFVHRQMSVVFCLQRFPMKIENCHIRHQRPPR